ncbi:MAG: host attachment protein [Verrucomicrobiota bacterium]
MTTLPPILIVTDRGHFVAYHVTSASVPEVIDRAVFSEGTEKISELVTDQAGRFPSGGTDGHRQSAIERPRLELELQMRCVRHIAERITELLSTHSGGWALAAPGEILQPILEHLPVELTSRHKLSLPKDLVKIPATEIADHFLKARQHA